MRIFFSKLYIQFTNHCLYCGFLLMIFSGSKRERVYDNIEDRFVVWILSVVTSSSGQRKIFVYSCGCCLKTPGRTRTCRGHLCKPNTGCLPVYSTKYPCITFFVIYPRATSARNVRTIHGYSRVYIILHGCLIYAHFFNAQRATSTCERTHVRIYSGSLCRLYRHRKFLSDKNSTPVT